MPDELAASTCLACRSELEARVRNCRGAVLQSVQVCYNSRNETEIGIGIEIGTGIEKTGSRGCKVQELIELANTAVSAALDKQASDIVLLDVHEVCGFADYFVICNAESDRQMNAVGEEIDRQLKEQGVRLMHQEGNAESGWLLMDFGAIVVHIFAPAARAFYQLDALWGEAPVVVRIQ